MNELKHKHFPNHPKIYPLILHREDILNKRGSFCVLQDPVLCRAFDEDLLQTINDIPFKLLTVVIDKVSHGACGYRNLEHPYHYSLLAMLERYCGRLKVINQRGDVMAESRGGTEDKALRQAYDNFYTYGDTYLPASLMKRTMTSSEIKIKNKAANIAGLQLADLLAHTVTRDVLKAYGRCSDLGGPFANRVMEIVRPKYHQNGGCSKGYGQKFLA